ncbi:SPFH domain-containing protein [Candidatus Halobeggiatoa sp. HSG11]|nr:SPFH domain-containing protein [Candidatus Halobeggiatoa sp. HSG11]
MSLNWLTFAWIFISLTLLAVGIILFVKSIHFVPQGMKYTVEQLGKYARTLTPGLSFTVPILEKVSNQIDIREKVMDVPRQDVITKDNAMITVDGVVFWRVFDAEKATYRIRDLEEAIMQLTVTNIRNVMGSMDLDDLLSKRNEINKVLLNDIDEATDPWGIKVTRVEIKDITPPEDLVNSMARQMKAERSKRAAILEAEGLQYAAIKKAEGEKRAMILKAEGQKESEVLEAEGYKTAEILRAEARKQANILEAEVQKDSAIYEAGAIERKAQAEAYATELVSKAIKEGDIQAINYFIAQKYVDALQNIASADNQKLIMMPLEATNLVSSIGGIGDIAKEIFTNKQKQTTKINLEE